uniref:MLO-like protein n=1 Tax=Quercus lobata TaxID=97700 RepID=A0A7N2M6B9_QUELO
MATKDEGKVVITAIEYSAPDRTILFSFYNHPQPLWVWADGTSINPEKLNLHGKVSFVSTKGIHQLHIFIFVLAVFHVLYCIITMALGKAKMRKWKAWEMETRTADYHFSNAQQFGFLPYCFYYLIPMIILLVGTKLRVIITMMGLRIQERGGVVKGTPLVQPGDDLFWFNRPCLIIYLIHFVLFQNAFQLAFFVWTWHQFGLKSCFHEKLEEVIIRISMGVLIQILCSYVTLPLYALVTQMGSNMKPTIFNERVVNALRTWHHKAKKNIKQNQHSTSTPDTPMHSMSPVHLLHHYQGEHDSIHKTQRMSNFNNEGWDMNGPHSSSHHHDQISLPKNQRNHGQEKSSSHEPSPIHSPSSHHSFHVQHESDVHSIDFSFDNS